MVKREETGSGKFKMAHSKLRHNCNGYTYVSEYNYQIRIIAMLYDQTGRNRKGKIAKCHHGFFTSGYIGQFHRNGRHRKWNVVTISSRSRSMPGGNLTPRSLATNV